MKKISILILLFLFLFVGCSNNKEEISYETYKSESKVLIVIKNNFKTEKDVVVKVKFKEDKEEIKTVEKTLYAVKGKDVSVGIDNDDLEYDDFNIDIDYSNSRKTNVYDNLVFKNESKEHFMKVNIINNNDYNVKASILVAYFMGDKFVSFDQVNNININMNSNYDTVLYYPNDIDEEIDFNKHIIFINESYR